MPRATLTIRFALIAVLLASVVPLGVGMGVSAFLNSRATVKLMWRDLADELVDHATETSLRYIEPGPHQLLLHRLSADEGALVIEDRDALMAALLRCLQAQDAITWCSWGGADGAYVAAYRGVDGAMQITHREQEDSGTRYLDYQVADGQRLLSRDEIKKYDPRTRPWWKVGIAAENPTWADPFLFASRRQPGVVLTLAQHDDAGQSVGVWLAEYELSHMASFLTRMKQQAQQRGGPIADANVYIVSRSGVVIGHPKGQTVRGSGPETELYRAEEHPDPQLRQAFARASEGSGLRSRQHFEFGGRGHNTYLGVSAPFPEGGPDWITLVTVPADSLLGPIYDNNRRAAGIAAFVALLSMLMGIGLAERFVRPLTRIAYDLEHIGRLDLPDKPDESRSRVREIADMIAARNRMTGGLRSFAKYVPAGLVRQLMDRGEEATLGGKTRELTVHFSDIVGFTSIAEQLTPQELVDALADYLGAMSDIIHEEQGTVDKYIGDAIMAFWGAPGEVDDHALRACCAALRCQERLVELRAQWEAVGRPAFRARIGVNSGDCLVGNIGSDSRINYTVMGDPVNVASRLEGQCKVFETGILIGERTRELAGEAIVARPVAKIAVKGKETEIVVYELLGLRGEVSDEVVAFAEESERGLSLCLSGEFDRAEAVFNALLAQRPDDVPLRLLLERCRHF